MTGPDEMVAFLTRCIDHDEEVALAVLGVNVRADLINGKPAPRWEFPPDSSSIYSTDGIIRVRHTWKREAEHIIRWDPKRVLDEVKVKRAILRTHARQHDCAWIQGIEGACSTIVFMVQSYAGQDGWREEWAL